MIKKPKIHNKTLWRGWKSMKPKGVVIHNDYGRMSALSYESWLRGRSPSLGIAHYYIDRSTIARYVNTNRSTYHTGDGSGNGNSNYIGYEVIQSRGPEFGDISREQFIENENMALRQASEDLQFYNLPINRTTVKLHNQFSSTSCPHLSQTIHGSGTRVQDYFIKKIKFYKSLGKTVGEMIDNENKGVDNKPSEKPVTQVGNVNKVAQEVIDGKWGNNPQRRIALQNAGYNYSQIQGIVNDILTGGNGQKRKTNKQVAQEVINGQWGNNPQRRVLLEKAGYNPTSVQRQVNSILNTKSTKSNVQLAKEVIQGKWGNNPDRKRKLEAAGYNYNNIQREVNKLI